MYENDIPQLQTMYLVMSETTYEILHYCLTRGDVFIIDVGSIGKISHQLDSALLRSTIRRMVDKVPPSELVGVFTNAMTLKNNLMNREIPLDYLKDGSVTKFQL